MSPFIVTAKRLDLTLRGEYLSRRAIATLEGARAICRDEVVRCIGTKGWFGKSVHEQYENLPESGGFIGPLPDGTVIEVEAIGAIDLFNRAGLKKGPPYKTVAEIIDAYNARENPSSAGQGSSDESDAGGVL